ncbi:MAG: hypothetical protein WA989_13250, partial [Henriciella sp.]|uniref:hypothetical protein n=1 Tax=Henriciella sp. TaxID=1968823 RepID=UPI003C7948C4
TIVAEGVETDKQSAFIEGVGCPQMQGYFIARAMPASETAEWLRNNAVDDQPITAAQSNAS